MKKLFIILHMLILSALAIADTWDDIWDQAVYGPAEVELLDQGTLHVPEGMVYLPPDAANDYSYYLGNTASPYSAGMVLSEDDMQYWAAYLSFHDEGYISDKDAKKWNVNELLQSYKDGTEEANKERDDISALEIVGWYEKPVYDPQGHTLTFAFEMLDYNVEADEEPRPILNYNIYKLGRYGYFEMIFASDHAEFSNEQPMAIEIINNISFLPETSYEAYNKRTDEKAPFSLQALISKNFDEESSMTGTIMAIGIAILLLVCLVAVLIIRTGRQKQGRDDIFR